MTIMSLIICGDENFEVWKMQDCEDKMGLKFEPNCMATCNKYEFQIN